MHFIYGQLRKMGAYRVGMGFSNLQMKTDINNKQRLKEKASWLFEILQSVLRAVKEETFTVSLLLTFKVGCFLWCQLGYVTANLKAELCFDYTLPIDRNHCRAFMESLNQRAGNLPDSRYCELQRYNINQPAAAVGQPRLPQSFVVGESVNLRVEEESFSETSSSDEYSADSCSSCSGSSSRYFQFYQLPINIVISQCFSQNVHTRMGNSYR